jgi:subtilisin family serine protease
VRLLLLPIGAWRRIMSQTIFILLAFSSLSALGVATPVALPTYKAPPVPPGASGTRVITTLKKHGVHGFNSDVRRLNQNGDHTCHDLQEIIHYTDPDGRTFDCHVNVTELANLDVDVFVPTGKDCVKAMQGDGGGICSLLLNTSAYDSCELDQRIHEMDMPRRLAKYTGIKQDTYYKQQYALDSLNVGGAWVLMEEAGPTTQVIVAVIDSGVNIRHPDLKGHIWTNAGEIAGDGIDNDGNGYVDDIHGWDFTNGDATVEDDTGHGTHCAGIIGASIRNGIGIAGEATNSIKIMPLKILDQDGAGSIALGLEALDYAIANGARVSSNSWGGYFGERELGAFKASIQKTVESKHLFVAAAGNDANNNDANVINPCAMEHDNILCVASTDQNAALSSFSNYGSATVDVAAPGTDIVSTDVGDSDYSLRSGTSMAAPYAAGLAGMMFASRPNLNPIEVKRIIYETVDKSAVLDGKVATGGEIDACAAMHKATNSAKTCAQAKAEFAALEKTYTEGEGAKQEAEDTKWSLVGSSNSGSSDGMLFGLPIAALGGIAGGVVCIFCCLVWYLLLPKKSKRARLDVPLPPEDEHVETAPVPASSVKVPVYQIIHTAYPGPTHPALHQLGAHIVQAAPPYTSTGLATYSLPVSGTVSSVPLASYPSSPSSRPYTQPVPSRVLAPSSSSRVLAASNNTARYSTDAMFNTIDRNHDGIITFDEYQAAASSGLLPPQAPTTSIVPAATSVPSVTSISRPLSQ